MTRAGEGRRQRGLWGCEGYDAARSDGVDARNAGAVAAFLKSGVDRPSVQSPYSSRPDRAVTVAVLPPQTGQPIRDKVMRGGDRRRQDVVTAALVSESIPANA